MSSLTFDKPWRNLNIGDRVCAYYARPRKTWHTIVAVDAERRNGNCQSGVMYKVKPPMEKGRDDAWIDSDWFRPTFEEME